MKDVGFIEEKKVRYRNLAEKIFKIMNQRVQMNTSKAVKKIVSASIIPKEIDIGFMES